MTERFPDERLEALFAAILIDDVVDAQTELSGRITLDHPGTLLARCFALDRQLWLEQVSHAELRELLQRLSRDRDLSVDDRLRFKHARAKLKHYRFACALYSQAHRYPRVIDWFTTALGHLQDAFKLGQRARVGREAQIARAFLLPGVWTLLRHRSGTLSDGPGFRAYLTRQLGELAHIVAHPTVTGHGFHTARKIVSRQGAFYNTLLTLEPSDDSYRMSRALAAINGLMGAMHDRLVEEREAGTRDYHREGFALPPEIAGRIAELLARYRASGLSLPVP